MLSRRSASFGPLQMRVFLLCMLCLILDGFDMQALSYTAPPILREFGLAPTALGAVFGVTSVGVLIGSLVCSAVADRVGRRPVIIAMTLFFSAMTLATSQAHTLAQLFWLRLLAGIGIGSIVPNATALVGEFSAVGSRVTLMMNITVGFTIGGAVGGFIAAALIPAFGWRSVFYFGGFVPLAIGFVMLAALPESPEFLAAAGPRRSAPFVGLFREGRSAVTLLLWVVNFMNLLDLYALSNWLTTVVNAMGYTTRVSVLVSTTLLVGGTVATFGLAWLIARRGFVAVLATTFAIAAVSIALIGRPGLPLALLVALVFIAGGGIVGAQPALNALSGSYYPTELRSTGVGWGLGVGRLGAIVGPYVGGVLLARHWTTQQLFVAAALPALASVATMGALRIATAREQRAAQHAGAAVPSN